MEIPLNQGPGSGDVALNSLDLPARLRTWIVGHGLTALSELARVSPRELMSARNLGRSSVAWARAEIEAAFGCPWEALAARSEADLVGSRRKTRASPRHLAEAVGEHPSVVPDGVAGRRVSRPGPDDVLLSSFDLPARLRTWIERKGVLTVRELAAVPPREMLISRNLGRRSVAAARALIESTLGARWEALVGSEGPGDVDASPSPPTRWDQIRVTLDDELRAAQIDEMGLPTRVRNYARRNGLKTLGELASRSEALLATSPNFDELSIQQLFAATRDHPTRAASRRALTSIALLDAWRTLLAEQGSVDRTVLTRRAGIGGPPETLQCIADSIGITRERVRQIEARNVERLRREVTWLRAVRARIDEALHGGAAALDELARDDWWRDAAGVPEALDFLGVHLLDGAVRVIEVERRTYLARCTQDDYDRAWQQTRAAAAAAVPCSLDELHRAAATRMRALGPTLTQVSLERLRASLHVAGADGERVVGFGNGHVDVALARLRASPVAMRLEELWPSQHREYLPEEVMLLGPSTVGLEQHFPDYATWMRRLVPAAVEIMERGAIERQWTAHVLRADLSEVMDVPAWLGVEHIASLLRRSGRVNYLGRLRVKLLGGDRDAARVQCQEEISRLLWQRGEPMTRAALLRALQRKVTVRDSGFSSSIHRPQFLLFDDGRVGLMERDLPGGLEALVDAIDHVAAALHRRGRGYGMAQALAAVQGLSATHALWTRSMCQSVLRGDARFQVSAHGAVGLATWEGTRVHSRTELLRDEVERAGGKVRVAVVQARLERCYGAPSTRGHLHAMAGKLGLKVRGAHVGTAARMG